MARGREWVHAVVTHVVALPFAQQQGPASTRNNACPTHKPSHRIALPGYPATCPDTSPTAATLALCLAACFALHQAPARAADLGGAVELGQTDNQSGQNRVAARL